MYKIYAIAKNMVGRYYSVGCSIFFMTSNKSAACEKCAVIKLKKYSRYLYTYSEKRNITVNGFGV